MAATVARTRWPGLRPRSERLRLSVSSAASRCRAIASLVPRSSSASSNRSRAPRAAAAAADALAERTASLSIPRSSRTAGNRSLLLEQLDDDGLTAGELDAGAARLRQVRTQRAEQRSSSARQVERRGCVVQPGNDRLAVSAGVLREAFVWPSLRVAGRQGGVATRPSGE